MRATLLYFRNFIVEDFKLGSYLPIILFTTLLVAFNYNIDFEDGVLDAIPSNVLAALSYFAFYFGIYILTLVLMFGNEAVQKGLSSKGMYVILFLTVLFIAVEINFRPVSETWFYEMSNSRYFSYKITSQLNETGFFTLLVIAFSLFAHARETKLFGLFYFSKKLKLYLILLAIMVPLIYIASLQADFLESYPKLRVAKMGKENYLNYFLAYEPFYLINFISTEWVFRGVLVLGLSKYLGKRAVLAAAVLYCVFHFGKPVAECISSFFGGYILGMIVYQTRSIWGGVIIHMGVALFMDVFALLGHF